QEMYEEKIKEHEQIHAAQQIAIQEAQAGFIPTGGYLVACDFYIQYNEEDPSKTRRARIPYEAIAWLLGKMDEQGMSQEAMAGMQAGAKAEMSQMISAASQGQQGQPVPQGPPQQQI
ncbi:MAG: hypothetical protein GY861_26805, partial [bacterium]|nr:hypothetical protein [bacterium]